MVLKENLRYKYLPFIVNPKCHWCVFLARNYFVFVTSSILIWLTWWVFANWNSYFNVFYSFAALHLWNRLWRFSWIFTCILKTKCGESPSCRSSCTVVTKQGRCWGWDVHKISERISPSLMCWSSRVRTGCCLITEDFWDLLSSYIQFLWWHNDVPRLFYWLWLQNGISLWKWCVIVLQLVSG